MSKNRITSGHYFRLCMLMMFTMPMAPVYAVEQPIGHLFSSPRERAALDLLRQKSGKTRVEINAPIEEQIGDQITLDGFVRKNNGKTTVWINQVPQHAQENPQGITILQSGRNPSTVSMQLPSGKNVRLKAGQTFDATNGKVTDVYDDATTPSVKEPAR